MHAAQKLRGQGYYDYYAVSRLLRKKSSNSYVPGLMQTSIYETFLFPQQLCFRSLSLLEQHIKIQIPDIAY